MWLVGQLPPVPAPVAVKPTFFQQFWRDLHLACACKPKIVRVQFFCVIVFLLRSNEISTFSIFRWLKVPILSGVDALGSIFGESFFCFGLMKYQQFSFFDGFVCCIGRPFNNHSWAFWNHQQFGNVESAQGFSYFLDARPNHIEWTLPTIEYSWAIRNHQQIGNCWNYTRFFTFFWKHIAWMLPTLQTSWTSWNHRNIEKC